MRFAIAACWIGLCVCALLACADIRPVKPSPIPSVTLDVPITNPEIRTPDVFMYSAPIKPNHFCEPDYTYPPGALIVPIPCPPLPTTHQRAQVTL